MSLQKSLLIFNTRDSHPTCESRAFQSRHHGLRSIQTRFYQNEAPLRPKVLLGTVFPQSVYVASDNRDFFSNLDLFQPSHPEEGRYSCCVTRRKRGSRYMSVEETKGVQIVSSVPVPESICTNSREGPKKTRHVENSRFGVDSGRQIRERA
ncbi:hypothetical protein BLNAU_19552 [Blattamonas nauphoetae]|uniref:Uncharacterized protein n=1 Tax=Blattamonas nauphoetae TaxID=2049346 RepID=A0ABQ9WMW0_9EUKA|nr:hypothetical protein BLNAU_24300 [Blattamonas nauphoetae]KAK2945528.1 hypothetical protein BLNAU_19552 [Blattamonas nauphoetae]